MKLNIRDEPNFYYHLSGQFNGKLKLERVNEFGS